MAANTPASLAELGWHRYIEASLLLRLVATAVILTFAMVVSVRARKDDTPAAQAYWTNLINVWMGRNSWGAFTLIFSIWIFFYFFSWLAPVLLRFEHLLAASATRLR